MDKQSLAEVVSHALGWGKLSWKAVLGATACSSQCMDQNMLAPSLPAHCLMLFPNKGSDMTWRPMAFHEAGCAVMLNLLWPSLGPCYSHHACVGSPAV